MRTFGVQEGEAITHPWLNRAIATAQKKVEQRNYEIRKNLLKYDDVVNDQRKAIFEQRVEFMDADDLSEMSREMRHEVVDELVTRHMPPQGLCRAVGRRGPATSTCSDILGLELPIDEWAGRGRHRQRGDRASAS